MTFYSSIIRENIFFLITFYNSIIGKNIFYFNVTKVN